MGRLSLVSPQVSNASRAPSVAASIASIAGIEASMASRATTPGTTARELEGCVKSLASLLEEHCDL